MQKKKNATLCTARISSLGFTSYKRKQDEAKSSAGDTVKKFLRLKVRAHATKRILQKESQLNFLAFVTQIYELGHKLLLNCI